MASLIQLTRKPFGNLWLRTLGDEQTHIQFVAERSAYIHQVRVGGRDLLLNYNSEAELTQNAWYRNHALLPFPNRLAEGKYLWNNQPFSFEINDDGSASALHGFGLSAPFKVDRFDLMERFAKVKLVYLHRPAEHLDSYPFLVRFQIELAVDLDAQSVEWKMSATNLGKVSAPVGLGWHPYFSLPGGSDEWRIQLPPYERVELENSLPTGKHTQGHSHRATRTLSSKQSTSIKPDWDDCFALTDPENLEILLTSPSYSLSLKQLGSTRYSQLYVPSDKTGIAIEPMTCNVNAFNGAKEEVTLEPNGVISTGMKMSMLG